MKTKRILKQKQHNFSDILPIKALKNEDTFIKITADKKECSMISKRLDLLSLDFFSGELKLSLKGTHTNPKIAVNGRIRAIYIQNCSVTLSPISKVFDKLISATFVNKTDILHEHSFIDPLTEDYFEINGGKIDFGEFLTEFLVLEIDPFPKKPGIGYFNLDTSFVQNSNDLNVIKQETAFSILKNLKKNRN